MDRITGHQLRQWLDIPSGYELDGLLKRHGVPLEYTIDDFEREGETSASTPILVNCVHHHIAVRLRLRRAAHRSPGALDGVIDRRHRGLRGDPTDGPDEHPADGRSILVV